MHTQHLMDVNSSLGKGFQADMFSVIFGVKGELPDPSFNTNSSDLCFSTFICCSTLTIFLSNTI